jgi:hypothetical protein
MIYGTESRVLTDIPAMLIVEETPVNSNQGIQDSDGAVKRELGDLRGWKLAIGIPELNDGTILLSNPWIGHNAIITSLLDRVVDIVCILQVNGLGEDETR